MKPIAMGGSAKVLALIACLVISASACDSGTEAPHGSPVLMKVYWVANDMQFLVWSRQSDPVLATRVPPFGSEIDFVFDRRLDGDLIEDTVKLDGGRVTTRPKVDALAPITATWADMAKTPGEPPFSLEVAYNSTARFGGASAYVFARPQIHGFPSDSTVTFHLDGTKLTSSYGEPMDGPPTVVVKTTAFSVAINVPGGDGGPVVIVGTDYQVPLAFTNRLPPSATVANFVKVRDSAGGLVPFKLLADAGLASRLYLAPADCLKAWPAKSMLEVTVEAMLPDAFGVPLPLPVKASFTTGAGSNAPLDGSACPLADGGTRDDGGSDVGAPDGGVVDADVDAGADAAAEVGTGTEDAASDGTASDAEAAAADTSAPDAD
jgi:hypothetical protein